MERVYANINKNTIQNICASRYFIFFNFNSFCICVSAYLLYDARKMTLYQSIFFLFEFIDFPTYFSRISTQSEGELGEAKIKTRERERERENRGKPTTSSERRCLSIYQSFLHWFTCYPALYAAWLYGDTLTVFIYFIYTYIHPCILIMHKKL